CIFASEVLVDCLKRGKPEEYEKTLRAHPVVSGIYGKALDYFKELSNDDLNSIGNFVNGVELTRMPAIMKAKLLALSLANKEKMSTLIKAVSYCNKYSW
ncbi:MAG: hypothetical protein HY365_03510, partial [Candidatus Aenigmarchaeota archaeon]|nr:hypothetical protein [Candidatus Aenigmarchaeota archaeon]